MFGINPAGTAHVCLRYAFTVGPPDEFSLCSTLGTERFFSPIKWKMPWKLGLYRRVIIHKDYQYYCPRLQV